MAMVRNSDKEYKNPEQGIINIKAYKILSYESEDRFGCDIYGHDFKVSVFSNVSINELAEVFKSRKPQIKAGYVTTTCVPTTIIRLHDVKDEYFVHKQANTCDATIDVKSQVDLQYVSDAINNAKIVDFSKGNDKFADETTLKLLAEQVAYAIEVVENKYMVAKQHDKNLERRENNRRNWGLI